MLTWEKEALSAASRKKYLAGRRKKTFREFLSPEGFKNLIFSGEQKPFYYAHVLLDWLEVRQTPPDVYAMAYETGLNMVGINVALNTYFQMLNSGQLVYFLPHYYYTFNVPEKYYRQQKITFEYFSELMGLIAEDLYMAGYEISKAAGGLGVYIPLIFELLEQISMAEVQGLNILNKLYRSKEFSFIEYFDRDPTFGKLMFNNLTYSPTNINFSNDPDKYFDLNWNSFNPLRFESLMQPYISKIYPAGTSEFEIFSDFRFFEETIVYDRLSIGWDSSIATSINYNFSMSETREKNNLVLTYINKPKNNRNGQIVEKIWVISGEANIQEFFKAGSWFLIQPLITNYLYGVYLVETGKSVEMNKILYPSLLTPQTLPGFVALCRGEFGYGRALGSSLSGYLKSKLINLQSGTYGAGDGGGGGGGGGTPCA